MNEFIEIRQLVSIVLRQWRIIVLGAVLGAVLGILISLRLPPIYEAKSTLLVGQSIQTTNLDRGDLEIGEYLALTYAEVGQRRPVLEGVVETLELAATWQQLQDRVRIRPVEGTQLLEISVEAPSPGEARMIADEIAHQMILLSASNSPPEEEVESLLFLEDRLESLRLRIENGQRRIEELEDEMATLVTAAAMSAHQDEIDRLEQMITGWESNYAQLQTLVARNNTVNQLALMEAAQAAPNPVRPRVSLNVLLGSMLGLGLALGVILVREYLDDTLRTTDDLRQVLGLTPLGAVGEIRGKGYREKLINSQEPFSPISEAFSVILSNVRFVSDGKPIGVILVTSAAVGEGKSLTAANLGLAMASSGLSTVIVDADLRRPAQHKIFEVLNETGVSDLLCGGDLEFDGHLSDSPVESLRLLTSGKTPPNPSELLSSESMELLLAILVDNFDIVIVDGPPVLSAADAAVLSNRVDAVVMVVDSGRTRRQAAKGAVTVLEQAGASFLGAVLNRASPTSHIYRYIPYSAAIMQEEHSQPSYTNWLRLPPLWKTRSPKKFSVIFNGQHDTEPMTDGDG